VPLAWDVIVIHDRGRTERVPLMEVLYLKAELKYVTVRTAQVARHAIRVLEKHHDPAEGGEGWALRVQGVPELLAVSRRQLPAVRDALGRP
jgi:two-component system response regulator AlgR